MDQKLKMNFINKKKSSGGRSSRNTRKLSDVIKEKKKEAV